MQLKNPGAVVATIVLVLCVAANCTLESSKFLIAYEDRPNVTIYSESPVLPEILASWYCPLGIWIAYNGFDYTSGTEDNGWGWINIYVDDGASCSGPLYQDFTRSVRPVGVLSNYTQASVTFFTDEDFGGNDYVAETELPELGFTFGSMITVNTKVEFFKETNFGGQSFCFEPEPQDCDKYGVCTIWNFIFDDLPFPIASVKSARIGCFFSNSKIETLKNTTGSLVDFRTFEKSK